MDKYSASIFSVRLAVMCRRFLQAAAISILTPWSLPASAELINLEARLKYVLSGYYDDDPEVVFNSWRTQIATSTATFTVENLRPNPNARRVNGKINSYLYDNVPRFPYSLYPSLYPTTTNPIGVNFICPLNAPFLSSEIFISPTAGTVACQIDRPTREADRCCKSKNPVQVTTGSKYLLETDYANPVGLDYVRTYRGATGQFTSVTASAFLDSSVAGLTTKFCYPLQHANFNDSAISTYCFRRVATGNAEYHLFKADGYSTRFFGTSSAPGKPANIDESAARTVDPQGNIIWTIRLPDDRIEVFSAAGELVSRTTRAGAVSTFANSTEQTAPSIAPAAKLLLSQTNHFGQTLQWRYNASSRVSKMIDPAGAEYDYTYDANQNLVTVTFPADQSGIRKVKTYHYENPTFRSALTGVTDENGWRHSVFTYDSAGRVAETKLQTASAVFANQTTFVYSTTSSSVTDALGTTRTYGYTNSLNYDRVTNAVQPCAEAGCSGTQSELTTYDANGNMASRTDRRGNRTNYTYDLARNLETTRLEGLSASGGTTAATRATTTAWHPTFRLPLIVTEQVTGGNKVTTNTYDANGNVSQRQVATAAGTRTWSWTYDALGRVLTATDPLGRTATNTYYPNTFAQNTTLTNSRGMLASITNVLGHTSNITSYNAHSQPLSMIDANGLVTTMA